MVRQQCQWFEPAWPHCHAGIVGVGYRRCWGNDDMHLGESSLMRSELSMLAFLGCEDPERTSWSFWNATSEILTVKFSQFRSVKYSGVPPRLDIPQSRLAFAAEHMITRPPSMFSQGIIGPISPRYFDLVLLTTVCAHLPITARFKSQLTQSRTRRLYGME